MKSFFFFSALLLFLVASYDLQAQAVGQHDALTKLGEGALFIPCYYTRTSSTTTVTAKDERLELHFVKNKFGRMHSFEFHKQGSDEFIINGGFGSGGGIPYLKPNHYTQPSLIYTSSSPKAYVYAEGLLYRLVNFDDPMNPTRWEVEFVYVPTGKKSNGQPYKVGFKSKFEGFDAQKKAEKTDHNAVLKKYFAAMKPIQEKATAEFTPEIKAEITELKGDKDSYVSQVQKTNADYWASDEGQWVLAQSRGESGSSGNSVTIKNNTGNRVYVMTELGTVSWIANGGNMSHKCGDNLYYCDEDGSGNHNVRGSLIYSGNSDCGGTLSLD